MKESEKNTYNTIKRQRVIVADWVAAAKLHHCNIFLHIKETTTLVWEQASERLTERSPLHHFFVSSLSFLLFFSLIYLASHLYSLIILHYLHWSWALCTLLSYPSHPHCQFLRFLSLELSKGNVCLFHFFFVSFFYLLPAALSTQIYLASDRRLIIYAWNLLLSYSRWCYCAASSSSVLSSLIISSLYTYLVNYLPTHTQKLHLLWYLPAYLSVLYKYIVNNNKGWIITERVRISEDKFICAHSR